MTDSPRRSGKRHGGNRRLAKAIAGFCGSAVTADGEIARPAVTWSYAARRPGINPVHRRGIDYPHSLQAAWKRRRRKKKLQSVRLVAVDQADLTPP